jgi:PAS domain S-box-containing protein
MEKAYQLFMNAPVSIGVIRGNDYIIELANEGLLEVWGRNAEVVGMPLLEAIPELDGQDLVELLDQVRTTGKPFFAYEYPIMLNKYGKEELLYFDFVYKPFYENESESQATGVICLGYDVTEKVTARKKVEEVTDLIRTITDNATSSLFMMNAKGYCTFMNAAGEKMFGYSQEEIRSRPLHYLIHHHRPDGSSYPMEECPLDRALPDNFDVRAHKDLFFRKDGSSLKVSCAASPIFEDGIPVATVIEVRDISLELEAEQALRRSAAELEQLVEERTRELTQTNEQLQQFTYAASHDLQEPLRKIRFFLDRLSGNIDPLLNEEDRRIFNRIDHTTARMQGLISDLLAYSNTTMGSTGFEEVELSELVKGVLDDMEATVIESNAVLHVDPLPKIKGDPRQLRQLFQNLISNGLKYHTKEAAPQVHITCASTTGIQSGTYLPKGRESEHFYLIEVRDNGIGFDPDDAERIFRLFQRLHGKSEYAGTGIGLAIVQKVVENHNGFIWAESEPGKGASFKILLPSN